LVWLGCTWRLLTAAREWAPSSSLNPGNLSSSHILLLDFLDPSVPCCTCFTY
jgi:hypothetical protein